jgi:hypothetical protein
MVCKCTDAYTYLNDKCPAEKVSKMDSSQANKRFKFPKHETPNATQCKDMKRLFENACLEQKPKKSNPEPPHCPFRASMSGNLGIRIGDSPISINIETGDLDILL